MKTPHFQSILAHDLDGLLHLRRSLGYREKSLRIRLEHIDRFLCTRNWDHPYLTRDLVEGWASTGGPIKPRSRAERIHAMRLIARFIAQTHPETYIPAPAWGMRQDPGFRPHIYTPAELNSLLTQAAKLTPSGSLRPKTYVALLGLLASTGMRISEALALNVADVDFNEAVLTVREAKFHKSRALPLHPTAVAPLQAYQKATHLAFVGKDREDGPFFVNQRGKRLHHAMVCATFLQIARAVGIRSAPGTKGPRIHDIRHSFATGRLLAWYQDGEDVQARLPLLSTYMGHVSIASTQVYLEATSELLAVAAARFQSPQIMPVPTTPGGPT